MQFRGLYCVSEDLNPSRQFDLNVYHPFLHQFFQISAEHYQAHHEAEHYYYMLMCKRELTTECVPFPLRTILRVQAHG